MIKNIEGAQARASELVCTFIPGPLHRMRQGRKWTGDRMAAGASDRSADGFDYEYAESHGALTGRLYNANLSRQAKLRMCLAFCDYASQKGYIPMVYANKAMLENNLNASAISEK